MSLALDNIILSIIMVIVVYVFIYAALNKQNLPRERKKKIYTQTTIIGMIYFAYILMLSYFQILFDFGMPPRFPIFMLIPIIFMNALFGYKCGKSEIVHALPVRWLVLIQSFRIIVELILIKMYMASIIPIEATLYGINYDMLVGISALPLAYLVWKNKVSTQTLIYWNLWGVLMVVVVALTITTSIYYPPLWGYTAAPINTSFLEMPLMLLPTFLAPLAIFTHVVTLIRLKNEK